MKVREALRAAIRDVLEEELRAARVGELLTIEDLARIFRVSRAHAYTLGRRIRRVQPPGTSAVRFAAEDVREYIEANKRGGETAAVPHYARPQRTPEQQARIDEIMVRQRRGVSGGQPSAEHAARVRETAERLRRGAPGGRAKPPRTPR